MCNVILKWNLVKFDLKLLAHFSMGSTCVWIQRNKIYFCIKVFEFCWASTHTLKAGVKKTAAQNKGFILTYTVSFKRFPHFLRHILFMWNSILNDFVPFTENLKAYNDIYTTVFSMVCVCPFPVLTWQHALVHKATSINRWFSQSAVEGLDCPAQGLT